MVWNRYGRITLLIFFLMLCFQAKAYDYDDNYDTQYQYYDAPQAEGGYGVEPRNDEHYSFVQNDYAPSGYDNYDDAPPPPRRKHAKHGSGDYEGNSFASRLPQQISPPGEKVIVINPRVHAWGAYDSSGNLVRGGVATAGSNYCRDIRRRCHTSVGTFRIYSLGGPGCKSSRYPLGRGGAPMPYCMFFNKYQALHGSHEVADANLSHGCVRLRVGDAEWLRYNFANIGTKVIVKPY